MISITSVKCIANPLKIIKYGQIKNVKEWANIVLVSDPAQLHAIYQSEEKNSNISIAEGDPFILRCRVGYSSNLVSGRWAPELRWYNHNNELLPSSACYNVSNLVRQDTENITATLAMHGKKFRCHTYYGAAQGNVGSDTENHNYSTTPPTYTEDQTIMINVDCRYFILTVNKLIQLIFT